MFEFCFYFSFLKGIEFDMFGMDDMELRTYCKVNVEVWR